MHDISIEIDESTEVESEGFDKYGLPDGDRKLYGHEANAALRAAIAHQFFFQGRGVDLAVRDARPYDFWTPEDTQPLKDAWTPFFPKDTNGKTQRGYPSWLNRVARQSEGYLITRYVPERLRGVPAISPEIRPLKPVMSENPQDALSREKLIRAGKYGGKLTVADLKKRRAYALSLSFEHPWRKYPAAELAKYVHTPGPEATRIDVHPRAEELFADADRVFFGIEGCIKADSILSAGEAVFSVPSVTCWKAPELRQFARKYLIGKTVFIVPDADWNENWMVINQALRCRSYLRALGVEHVYIAAPPIEEGAERDEKDKLVHNGVDDFRGAGGKVDDLVVIGREMPPEFDEWVAKVRPSERDAKVMQALSLCAGLRKRDMRYEGDDPEGPGEIKKSAGSIAPLVEVFFPDAPMMSPRTVRAAFDSLERLAGLRSDRAITIDGSTDLQSEFIHETLETLTDDWQTTAEIAAKTGRDEKRTLGRLHRLAARERAKCRKIGKTWQWAERQDAEPLPPIVKRHRRSSDDWEAQPTIIVAEELRAVPGKTIRLGDLTADLAREWVQFIARGQGSLNREEGSRSTLASL